MWGLPTIIAINQKLAQGQSLDQAYVECGIRVPGARGADAFARFGDKSPLKSEAAVEAKTDDATEETVEVETPAKAKKAKNVA